MRGTIHLKGTQPVATGHKRVIYQHPQDDGLLIKIVPDWTIEKRWGTDAPWYKRRNRPGIYEFFHREMSEYICLRAREPEFTGAVQKIIGLADTDLGLGMVVEKLVDEKGGLAPQLRSLLAQSGFTAELASELDRLVQELLRCGVILGKLNASNIVLATDRKHGTRFVIIDGFGQKTLIPTHSWSRRANRFNTRRKVKRLYREIERLTTERPAREPSDIALART